MTRALSLLTFTALTGLASTATAAEPPAWWQGKLSGNVAFVSDYAYRGISQTAEGPATQAGLEYVLNNGLKLDAWTSNVNFDTASLELDLYASYPMTFGHWTVEPGAIYYAYPGAASAKHYDYYEGSIAVGYDFGPMVVTGSFYASPDTFGGSGFGTSTRLDVKVPLPHNLTFETWAGYQTAEDNIKFGVPDYVDWSVSLAYALDPVTLKLQYVDTNLSNTQCTDGCDAKLIASVTYAF